MNIINTDNFNKSKISLNRQILNWEWYTEIKTFKLFIHCLLRANFKDVNYRGILVKRGQFITSLEKLSVETGLTKQEIRTAIKHLVSTHELTHQNCTQYSVITINKYSEYQENFTSSTHELTHNQHATNTRLTTNNNDNNDNNEVVVKENEKNFYGEYYNIYLTDKQYKELEVLIMSKKKMKEILNNLSVNIETGKEKKFNPELPNAHYERVKAYFNYMRKNPNKFKSEDKTEQEYWDNDEDYRAS